MHGDIFATVEAIHAAGLDAALWPRAIELMTRSIGGVGGTLEVIDGPTLRHREFISQGLPTAAEMEYLDQYAALNVRIPSFLTAKIGDTSHDYAILDADAMARSPFYTEFLRRYDLRFFIPASLRTRNRSLPWFPCSAPQHRGMSATARLA
jgi:hypothetical protein